MSSSDVSPKESNCLKDCLKLLVLYLILSLSVVSTEAKSIGFQTSPVENI